MSIVALVGDATTTTAVALASTWPTSDEVVVLEADRTGGSLAGWLDTPATPSLSTIVANSQALETSPSAAWSGIDSMVQRSASGVRFIAAPIRAREASRSIIEAGSSLFPLLAALNKCTFIADCGRASAVDGAPTPVVMARTVVITHRQQAASAGAASVRLDRLAELVEGLVGLGVPLHVAVIGDRPFDLDEIGRFVSGDGAHDIMMHALAHDELTAAVFAGRTGVSAKRLARLPLMRSARGLSDAAQLSAATTNGGASLDRSAGDRLETGP